MRIIGLGTQGGAVPFTQKNATIDIRIFTGSSAFSILLRDTTFYDERGEVLSESEVEILKNLFLEYVTEGESEYLLIKTALGL